MTRRPGRRGAPWSGRRRRGSRGSSPGRRARRCAGARRTRSSITPRRETACAALTWSAPLTRASPGPASRRTSRSRSRPGDTGTTLHKARCACGRVHVADRPAGVPDAPLSVGPRLSAMAVYLSVFQHIPVERAQFLIVDLTGGVVSAGLVHSCLGKAAGLVTDVVRLIRTLIAAAPVAGFDETTLRSEPAGDKKYVHGAFTELYSAFWLGTRSLETMREAGILPSFAGIVGQATTATAGSTSPGTRPAPPTSSATSPTAARPTPAPPGRSRPSAPCAASSVPGTPPASRDFPPFPLKSATAGDRVPPRPARRGAGSMLRRVR
jgi:transposase